MYTYVESKVLGWMVCCAMYHKAKYTCTFLTECTVHPGTSDSTYGYTDMA